MIKGQKLLVYRLNIIWPLCMKVAKLVQWMPLGSTWPLFIFRSQSKVKVKLLIFEKMLSTIYLDPFAEKFLNLIQWMPLGSTWPLFIFRSQSKVKVKLLIFEKMLSTIYLDSFAEKFLNLIQWMPLGSRSTRYSISCDLSISVDIKKVKLWIKVKLSTANHLNAASKKKGFFATKPCR